jgi:hypothetical protein
MAGEVTIPVRYRLTEAGPIEDPIDGDFVLVPFPQVQLQDQLSEAILEVKKLRGAMTRAARGGY